MNLEHIREERLKKLKDQQELNQKIAQFETLAKNMLSQRSWERYTNIKIADNEKSLKILGTIAQAHQQGMTHVTDEQFLELLKTFDDKKDTKIRFVRK